MEKKVISMTGARVVNNLHVDKLVSVLTLRLSAYFSLHSVTQACLPAAT